MAKAKKTTAKKTTAKKTAAKAPSKKQVINESNSHKALAIAFFGIAILCIIFVSLALLPNKLAKDENSFDKLQYDIIIEKHRYEYEGWNPAEIPETGYSTNYYYSVINSERHEKYTIVYQDVWSVHNERGDYDTISVSTETVSDEDLDKYIEKYGKNPHLLSVKDFFEADVKEEYLIKGSKSYDEYMKKKNAE